MEKDWIFKTDEYICDLRTVGVLIRDGIRSWALCKPRKPMRTTYWNIAVSWRGNYE